MSDTQVGLSAFKCNTRTVRDFIIDCITAKKPVVPFVKSSPGMGKSSIVHGIADEFHLELLDHRLSTSAPEDLTGLPRFKTVSETKTVAEFAPFEMFPTEETPLPKGKDGWLLFLDEFNSASKSVQAAAYKLVLDRMVGQHRLHERCVIVAAGNLATDRAIVNQLGTAMQSRLVHLNMEVVFNHWLEDVAITQRWDPRIIAFLSYIPGRLMDFRPDHTEDTFCCPRTWEFVNNLIKDRYETHQALQSRAALLAGTITSGVATEFIQFTKVFEELPKIKDVLAQPNQLPVPTDPGVRYAAITYLVEHVNDKDFAPIADYINRFGAEFRVLFFRAMLIRQAHMRSHPVFAKAMGELARYLNG